MLQKIDLADDNQDGQVVPRSTESSDYKDIPRIVTKKTHASLLVTVSVFYQVDSFFLLGCPFIPIGQGSVCEDEAGIESPMRVLRCARWVLPAGKPGRGFSHRGPAVAHLDPGVPFCVGGIPVGLFAKGPPGSCRGASGPRCSFF